MFDIFLACAPKDFNKLPFVINAAAKNIRKWDKIYICIPKKIPPEILNKITGKYTIVYDKDVLPIDRKGWKFRPNWLFQQHLKLFQEVTQDWYLTLDCDTIINRPMDFYENGKPVYWKGQDQFYAPYFIFQALMIGLPKISDTSYIADMNFINRALINEMLDRNNYTRETFIAKSQEITTKYCHLGEPELYGSYCFKYYPDLYIEKFLKQKNCGGRPQKTENEFMWNESETIYRVREIAKEDYDTWVFHSWLDEGDQ